MSDYSSLTNLFHGLWNLFCTFNGSSIGNSGIEIGIGLFFSAILFLVIKMRALSTMKNMHIVGMVGALLIFISYLTRFVFEWGYQIGLYNDQIILFLFPPIEHFFYMMGLGCMAYYSLNYLKYYPGLLKRVLWTIPILITVFFVYATIEWKTFFMNSPTPIPYYMSDVDWQSHALMILMSGYVFIVSLIKNSRYRNHYMPLFWGIIFVQQLAMTTCYFNNTVTTECEIIFRAIQIWSIPILILHFVKAYVIKLGFCRDCTKNLAP